MLTQPSTFIERIPPQVFPPGSGLPAPQHPPLSADLAKGITVWMSQRQKSVTKFPFQPLSRWDTTQITMTRGFFLFFFFVSVCVCVLFCSSFVTLVMQTSLCFVLFITYKAYLWLKVHSCWENTYPPCVLDDPFSPPSLCSNLISVLTSLAAVKH